MEFALGSGSVFLCHFNGSTNCIRCACCSAVDQYAVKRPKEGFGRRGTVVVQEPLAVLDPFSAAASDCFPHKFNARAVGGGGAGGPDGSVGAVSSSRLGPSCTGVGVNVGIIVEVVCVASDGGAIKRRRACIATAVGHVRTRCFAAVGCIVVCIKVVRVELKKKKKERDTLSEADTAKGTSIGQPHPRQASPTPRNGETNLVRLQGWDGSRNYRALRHLPNCN